MVKYNYWKSWVYSLIIFAFAITGTTANEYVLDLRYQTINTLEKSHLKNHDTYHTIDASYTSLEFITPHLLENLKFLTDLKLDGNPEFKIRKTEAFLHVPTLTLFSCSGCGFVEIHEKSFSGLQKLQTLNLSNNQIKSISKDAFVSNQGLTHVNLSGNALDDIRFDTFLSNKQLNILDLSSNKKLNVKEGAQLIVNSNLQILLLSGCNFSILDDNIFSGLPNLKEIYLQHNFIHKVHPHAFKLNPLLANISLENNYLEQLPLAIITDQTKNLCLDRNHFKLTRGYIRLYYRYEKIILRRQNSSICENQNETMKFEWLVNKHQLNVTKAGISDAFISTYILTIVVAEILVLFLLIFCFMKSKKKINIDDLSQTILNDNSIYKIMKND